MCKYKGCHGTQIRGHCAVSGLTPSVSFFGLELQCQFHFKVDAGRLTQINPSPFVNQMPNIN